MAENNVLFDLVYLLSCAINEKKPDPERVSKMNLDKIYALSERHMIKAAVAESVEAAGFKYARFSEAAAASLRRTVIFEKEWGLIKARFEAENIKFAALKGAVLRSYYPKYGMREFADNDILIDASRADDVRAIMEELGYSVIQFGASNHDVYQKPPFLNFEIHTLLYGTAHDKLFYEYYLNVFDRLRGDGCEKRFSDEDFYIHMISHEYKHYSHGGTGLRSLADTYVFLHKKNIDTDYVRAETEKLGIREFEEENRALSTDLFDLKELTEKEKEMLSYIVSSGTYGTITHSVENTIKKNGGSKLKYMIDRFTVPFCKKDKRYNSYAGAYPFFYKYKIFLPFLPFYRLIRSFISGKFKAEARAIKRAKKQ